MTNSNVTAFLNQQSQLSNDELKRMYHFTDNCGDSYDDINDNEIAEYFKCQRDMIMNELLTRFNGDLESMLSFLN